MERILVNDVFNCPICFELLAGEIYQCRSGHSICPPCSQGMELCPQCREPFGEGKKIRNRILEELIAHTEIGCQNKERGCPANILRKDVDTHHATCAFQGPGLFDGLIFKVVVNDVDNQGLLEASILANDGTLTTEIPQIVILSTVCNREDTRGAMKARTQYWLTDLLFNGTFNIARSFQHVPFYSFPGMDTILKDKVFAISGYPFTKGQYLIDLIKAMGGRYQQAFAKKDDKDSIVPLLRSTHLISATSQTDRALAAQRWKTQVVVGEWVIDCFIERKLVHEDKYNPDKYRPAAY